MDDSISPESSDAGGEKDLCVDLKTLEINGTQPEVGDIVDLKVKGSLTKIVNGCGWVTPDTINGQPVPAAEMASDDDLMEAAKQHDMGGMAMSGY